VAKRSVKKGREREQGAARPAAASVARPNLRQFWVGVIVAAVVLIPLAAVGIVIASSGDAPADPAAQQQTALRNSIQSEAATLRKQTQVRDKEQVQELTERMRGTADALDRVIAAMRTKRVASPAVVAAWRQVVRKENGYFAETVSGETGTNVARGGFAASLDAMNEAVESYALALKVPSGRDALLARAREQRDLAVRTWSVAATQLDAINIATGFGHQHVYLGATQAAGGFSADPAPEGSGATGGG
jgi:hypothetical protein